MNWALVGELTTSQMRARYRRTWAGFLWVILNPIIMFTAQSLVFKKILRIGVPDYAVFLLGGLLPWIFIVTSLDMGIPVLLSSRELMIAYKIPPLVLVLSSLLDNWINFLAAFVLVLVPALFLSSSASPGLLLLPLAALVTLLGVAGLLWFLSIFNVFYRDTRFLVHFMISVLFFLTPIFYPKEFIPAEYQWLIRFNVIYALIEPIRNCIYSFSADAFFASLARGAVAAAAMLALSFYYWKKRRNDFYYYL